MEIEHIGGASGTMAAVSDLANSYLTWILGVAIGAVVLVFLSRYGPGKRNLPPGPRNWPVVGALFSLEPRLYKAFEKLAAQYGPIVYYRVGVQEVVVIASAELAEEVLKQKDLQFANRAVPMTKSVAKHIGFESSVFPYSDYEAEFRLRQKVSIQEFFTGTALKSYDELRSQEVAVMVEKIFRQIENSKPNALTTVGIWDAVSDIIRNVMLRVGIGKRFDSTPPTDELRKFPLLLAELYRLFMEFNLMDCFPYLKRIVPQGLVKEFKTQEKLQRDFYGKIVEDRRQERKLQREAGTLTEYDKGSPNFVDALLGAQEQGGGITDDGIMGTTMTMLAAGIDTTSAETEWVMVELARHPKVLQKLHTEIDTVVETDRPLQESDLQDMPYLRAVVLEALRLHPVIPMTFPHVSKEESIIGGYYIPPDAAVFVNLYGIGRNPTTWKDPLQFNPDRFIPNASGKGVESMKANGSNFHLLPFGSGRRMCLGHTLAMVLLSRTVATLVHAFDWAAPPGVSSEDLLTSESGFFMLHPGPKLYLFPTPRLSSKVYQSKFN